MTPEQAQARHLFFDGQKTQKEIAAEIGVSEKTIYNWIQYFSWHKLREAAIAAPAMIADNICSQLIEFQKAIAAREEGMRYPTPEEINQQCKLIGCLEKLKKYPNRGQTVQALSSFLNYIDDNCSGVSAEMWECYNQYMKEKTKDGYKPYNLEFGVNPFVHTPPGGTESAKTANRNAANQPEGAMKFQPESQYSKASQPLSGPLPPPEKTGNQPEADPEITVTNTPAVTEKDFNDYKHLLRTTQKPSDAMRIRFKGEYVSAKWLEYNLFQYHLPPADRRFINDALYIQHNIDYKTLRQTIVTHFATQQNKAA